MLCAVTIPPADLRSLSLFYTYKHVFNIILVLNVEVIVF